MGVKYPSYVGETWVEICYKGNESPFATVILLMSLLLIVGEPALGFHFIKGLVYIYIYTYIYIYIYIYKMKRPVESNNCFNHAKP